MAEKIDNKTDLKSKKDEMTFEQMMADASFDAPVFEIGQRVEKEIVAIDNEHIFLDMGTRVEGIVKRSEFTEYGEITVIEGDIIPVYVVGKRGGAYLCSRKMGGAGHDAEDQAGSTALKTLTEAFHQGVPVEGKVTAVVKGGFEVNVLGQKCFCPISLIDKKFCSSPDDYLNETYTFMITRLEEEGRNIVLSRKEILVEEDRQKARELWEKIEEGEVREGTVTAVKNYGVFVDIGGIEGLLHVSEISHDRVDNPAKLFKPGDTMSVELIQIDRPNRRVGLSLKSQQEDPWFETVSQLKIGSEYKGKVIRLKNFGAFVELLPGVDGLLHISKLGTDRRVGHPKEVLNIGDIVDVRIENIDESQKRIALTMEKEEMDYSKELDKIKKEQNDLKKHTTGTMADLLDDALTKK